MTKQRKVNIKFYANNELKPSVRDETKFFPLYVRVGYRRKNTKFKFTPQFFIPEEDTDNLEDWINLISNTKFNLKKAIQLTQNMVEGLIRYEEEKLGDKFELKGLGDRLRVYKISLVGKLSEILVNNFRYFAKNVLTVNQYESIENLQFTGAVTKLTENYGAETVNKILFYKTESGISSEILFPQMLNLTLVSKFAHSKQINSLSVYDWLVNGYKQEYLTFITDFANQIKDDDDFKVIELVGNFLIHKEQFLSVNFEQQVSIGIEGIVNNLMNNAYGDTGKLVQRFGEGKIFFK
jgi:hypothetical protein